MVFGPPDFVVFKEGRCQDLWSSDFSSTVVRTRESLPRPPLGKGWKRSKVIEVWNEPNVVVLRLETG